MIPSVRRAASNLALTKTIHPQILCTTPRLVRISPSLKANASTSATTQSVSPPFTPSGHVGAQLHQEWSFDTKRNAWVRPAKLFETCVALRIDQMDGCMETLVKMTLDLPPDLQNMGPSVIQDAWAATRKTNPEIAIEVHRVQDQDNYEMVYPLLQNENDIDGWKHATTAYREGENVDNVFQEILNGRKRGRYGMEITMLAPSGESTDRTHYLFIHFNHSVFDMWSLASLYNEFTKNLIQRSKTPQKWGEEQAILPISVERAMSDAYGNVTKEQLAKGTNSVSPSWDTYANGVSFPPFLKKNSPVFV